MPIYEYACPDCGHKFERMQRMSEDPVKVCPTCAKENVRKLISQTSFALKGSGWYSDHYGLRSGGDSESSSSSSSSAGGSTGSSESSSGGDSAGGGDSSSGSDGASSAPASTPAAAPSTASSAAD